MIRRVINKEDLFQKAGNWSHSLMQLDGKAASSSSFYTSKRLLAKERKGWKRATKNQPGAHREGLGKFSQLSLPKQRPVEKQERLRRQDSSFCQQKQAKSQGLQVKNRQNKGRVK